VKPNVAPFLVVLCLAASPVLAKPTMPAPPAAGDAIDKPVDPATAVVPELGGPRIAIAPRPALSSKATLAGVAGVAPTDLGTPAVLSLARPRVGKHKLFIEAMATNDPDSGAAVFFSAGAAAKLSIDTAPGHTYVVECTGDVGDWYALRYERTGDTYEVVQDAAHVSTERPMMVFSGDEHGTAVVVFRPLVVDGGRILHRCQVAATRQPGGK
jgi:hypothetical protein